MWHFQIHASFIPPFFPFFSRGCMHVYSSSDIIWWQQEFSFFFCFYFKYFWFRFCKCSLVFVWVRHATPGTCVCACVYVNKSYVQILCLVSYMLKLFFSEVTWIYANRQNKDVQNKVLNVYCTLYSICLKRRVNVFFFGLDLEWKKQMFTVRSFRKRWPISLSVLPAQPHSITPTGSIFLNQKLWLNKVSI